jgi:IS30 family transposase
VDFSHLNDEDIQTCEDVIRVLHRDAKMSIRTIAPIVGASPSTVMQILHEQSDLGGGRFVLGTTVGLDGRARPDRRYDTSERDRRIEQLREAGKSVREVAREVGCSVGTVHRVLKG